MVVSPSVECVFVFVSPDGSGCRNRSGLQGRGTRAIYPCRTGCDGKRLPEADTKEKRHGEKRPTNIPRLSASTFAVVKGFGIKRENEKNKYFGD